MPTATNGGMFHLPKMNGTGAKNGDVIKNGVAHKYGEQNGGAHKYGEQNGDALKYVEQNGSAQKYGEQNGGAHKYGEPNGTGLFKGRIENGNDWKGKESIVLNMFNFFYKILLKTFSCIKIRKNSEVS